MSADAITPALQSEETSVIWGVLWTAPEDAYVVDEDAPVTDEPEPVERCADMSSARRVARAYPDAHLMRGEVTVTWSAVER